MEDGMDFGMEEVFLKQMMIIWSVTALLGQWRRGRRAARSMEVPGKPLKRKDGFYRLPHGKVRKNRFRPRAKKNETPSELVLRAWGFWLGFSIENCAVGCNVS